MATIAAPPIDRQSSERKFYSRMAIALVVVMFLGFAPSFYLRGIVPEFPRPNPSLTPFVILHGMLFTAWMAVLVAQTRLIAAGRRDVHMKLGAASMVLAIALLPTMYLVGVWQVARANQPPFTDPLTWTIVPLAVIPVFAFLIWQAWKRRMQAQWHKRLMLSAAITLVGGPAIGRLPLAPPTLGGMTFQLLLGLALFVPMFIWDRRSTGHIHPATWLGFGLGAASVLVPLLIFWTGADWASVARNLPGVGG
jgi:cytochrome bd-type quinol oxidase subunit 2